ncbi:MAG: hypothetical protein K2X55_00970 [Burkholderiaceae bacterium]|nr:hypothetical protein [Burkholderiaceae bacterium]
MTITQTITAMPPVPDPASDSADEFSDKAAATVLAQKNMVPELNTFIGQANATAVEVNAAAQEAIAASAAALASEDSAAASAASAISAPGTNATSITSLTVGSGTISFTVQTGKAFVPGMWGNLVRTSDRTKRMNGYVDSYNSGTGALVLIVAAADVNGAGTGPYTDWTFSLGAARIGALAPVDLSLVGPSIRPSLLADFANSKRLPAGFVYTMPDALTYTDAAGILRSAAPGVPAFNHDPATLLCRGWLDWESRTNSIRNNSMQGVSAGTPGTAPTYWSISSAVGLSTSVVGSGTEDNIAYIDVRFFGTASSVGASFVLFETSTGVTASSGQTWAAAAYLKMIAGSTANIASASICMDEKTSGGAYVAGGSVAVSLSAALLRTSRQSYVRTLSGGGTVARLTPYLALFNNAIGSVDITLRIGLPQLEQGNLASPTIITSGSAVTRGASSLTIATSAFDFNPVEGTLYVEGDYGQIAALNPTLARLDDGTENNRIMLRAAGATQRMGVVTAGTDVADIVLAAPTPGVPTRVVGAYKANDFAASKDGASVVTDTNGAVPTVNILRLGGDGSAFNCVNGHIAKFAYYPRRLANAELVALSTL